MIQRLLLPDAVGHDRWRPLVPPLRLRHTLGQRRRVPLPTQMYLPGMEPLVDGREASHGVKENRFGNRVETRDRLLCPNCGGTAFDEDGDCTACWEPGVLPLYHVRTE